MSWTSWADDSRFNRVDLVRYSSVGLGVGVGSGRGSGWLVCLLVQPLSSFRRTRSSNEMSTRQKTIWDIDAVQRPKPSQHYWHELTASIQQNQMVLVTATQITSLQIWTRHRASFRRSSGGAVSRRSTGVCASSADKMGVSSDPPLRLLRGATRWAGSPSCADQQGRTKLSPS